MNNSNIKDRPLLTPYNKKQKESGTGRKNFAVLAKAAGAIVVIGDRNYINNKIFDEYVDSISGAYYLKKNEGSKEHD